MKSKTDKRSSLDHVMHYIDRKAEFGNTLSVDNARRAAQFAYDAGRESVVENMSKLKWAKVFKDGPYVAIPSFSVSYRIEFAYNEFNLFCNSIYISCYISLSEAKRAANEDYKRRIKQALEL